MNSLLQRKQRLKQDLLNKQQMDEYQNNKLGLLSNVGTAVNNLRNSYGSAKDISNASILDRGNNLSFTNPTTGLSSPTAGLEGVEAGANIGNTASNLAKVGEVAGKALPYASAAMGGVNAVNRFGSGDTTGGALEIAKLGMLTGNPIGMAIGGAATIADMLLGARNQKKQATQQAAAQNQAIAEADTEKAIQNINDSQQQLEQDFANNPYQPVNNTQNTQQLTQNGQDILNAIQGVPTGFATSATTAPVQQQPTQLSGTVAQNVNPNGQQVYQTNNGTGRIAQLMNEFKQGYQDNTENTLGNTYFAPNQQKTFFNRLGEAVGTGQRIASNPIVQGLVAGGVDYANGSNFGKSALTGIDWARNKADSDRYEQLINGNNKRSFLGGYTSDDYDSKVNKDYKDQQLQNAADEFQWKQDEATKKFNYQQELNKQKMELEKQKLENDKAYKNNMIALRKEQIKNGRNSGYGRTAKYDPTQNPDFYDDYDKYEAFDSMEEGTDEYNQEVDDMLEQMYGGKTPGSAWGYYSAQERANAKNEVDKIINQQKKAFMKKYRINPMTSKGKKK